MPSMQDVDKDAKKHEIVEASTNKVAKKHEIVYAWNFGGSIL
jgi:hypothetical protein